MSTGSPAPTPFIDTVFHPTDFSAASERAFAHALAVALIRRAEFTILHSGRGAGPNGGSERVPEVRRTLERWGLLAPGAARSDVAQVLGLKVRKAKVEGADPLRASLEFVALHRPDLIVLTTGGRSGLARWLRPSVAERLARRTRSLTLFVPARARGFVSPQDGHLTLHRILVPIASQPAADTALAMAVRTAQALGDRDVRLRVLHVGSEAEPAIEIPSVAGVHIDRASRPGAVVDGIAREAEQFDADLVVMATAGRSGLGDALLGSDTERVLRRLACPLLAVPSR